MTTYLKIFIITLLAALPTLGLAQPALIPSPKAIELAEGNFKAGKKIGVAISDASLQPAAEYLAESLSAYGEIADTPADKADIELRLGARLAIVGKGCIPPRDFKKQGKSHRCDILRDYQRHIYLASTNAHRGQAPDLAVP